MPLSPALKMALISQVSCGNAELKKKLEEEIDFISDCQDDSCTPRLKYIYTLLGLIEYAQIFSRLQIDTATRIMQHTLNETYVATGRRNTDGESTTTGRSCNWASATSQQYFNRDSTDDMVSFNERDFQRTAQKDETGYDKSCRHTTGHGFNFSHVEHRLSDTSGDALGTGQGTQQDIASRNSSTNGGTGNFIPLIPGYKYDPFGISISPVPPFIEFGDIGPGIPDTIAGSGDEICPPYNPDDIDAPDPCQRPAFASYGMSHNAKITISIGIPGTGAIQAEFTRGHSFRQYYHCTLSNVFGKSTVNGKNNRESDGTTLAFPDQNRSSSREITNVYHLVRKYGTSTRRGYEQVTGQERSNGVAEGVSHAESAHDQKGNSFQQGRSESLTVGHTESHLRREEHLTDDQVRRSYGQISKQLAKLWQVTWDNVQVLQKQFAAQPFGAPMSCNVVKRIGCYGCPPFRSYSEICNGSFMSGSCNTRSV